MEQWVVDQVVTDQILIELIFDGDRTVPKLRDFGYPERTHADFRAFS